MWLYEPGPVAPLDPSQFPRRGQLAPDIEQAVVPQSAAMFEAERQQALRVNDLNAAGVPDVDGDHARMLAPAYYEVAHQEGERWALTTDEAIVETAAAVGEFQGIADELPAEDSDWSEPTIPGEGDDTIPTSDQPGDLGIDIPGGPGTPPPNA